MLQVARPEAVARMATGSGAVRRRCAGAEGASLITSSLELLIRGRSSIRREGPDLFLLLQRGCGCLPGTTVAQLAAETLNLRPLRGHQHVLIMESMDRTESDLAIDVSLAAALT